VKAVETSAPVVAWPLPAARYWLNSNKGTKNDMGVRQSAPCHQQSPDPRRWPTDLIGLRDRALIGIMAYSFARVGAVIRMKVGDYFMQGRRRWVRLHEKGGKEHDVPCHHNLDHYVDAYIDAAGIAGDVDGYLFRTASGKTGMLNREAAFPAGRLWSTKIFRRSLYAL
jgi:integrase